MSLENSILECLKIATCRNCYNFKGIVSNILKFVEDFLLEECKILKLIIPNRYLVCQNVLIKVQSFAVINRF